MAPGSAFVRPATEADLSRLIELLQQLSFGANHEDLGPPLPDVYGRVLRDVLADQRQQLFVIEDGGELTGSAVLVIVPNLTHQGRPYALVENVVVEADLRRLGYGELLMRHLIEEARAAGCYKVALTSNEQRLEAHRFYEKLGFITTQRAFRINFD